jgi:C4-dicarboxylate transporter DctQ subunit
MNKTILHRFACTLEKAVNVCVLLFLAVLAVSVIIQVLGRSFNIPVAWLGELSIFCLIWLVFFGLSIGYRHGLFAQVDVICFIIPAGWKKYMQILWDLTGLAILFIVIWSSRDYILHTYRSRTVSSELELPLYIVYMGPVLGYIFTAVFTVVKLIDRFNEIKKDSRHTERRA